MTLVLCTSFQYDYKNVQCGTCTISLCAILIPQPIETQNVASTLVNNVTSGIKISHGDIVQVLH